MIDTTKQQHEKNLLLAIGEVVFDNVSETEIPISDIKKLVYDLTENIKEIIDLEIDRVTSEFYDRN